MCWVGYLRIKKSNMYTSLSTGVVKAEGDAQPLLPTTSERSHSCAASSEDPFFRLLPGSRPASMSFLTMHMLAPRASSPWASNLFAGLTPSHATLNPDVDPGAMEALVRRRTGPLAALATASLLLAALPPVAGRLEPGAPFPTYGRDQQVSWFFPFRVASATLGERVWRVSIPDPSTDASPPVIERQVSGWGVCMRCPQPR
jgi:hypothetical protein